MAGVAEKARFFLERSVPQLREWEEKGIFDKEEIRSIVKKRNDYEHRILSPGNLPSEWSSYAKWEQSLESLRSKRCQRLKIRHLESAHAGQARVLAIYERSIGRHPGSGALWREYLAYTTAIKAAKRWRTTMNKALRMMPRDAEMWMLAGRRFARDGDMASARSFFMRGCRFCTTDCALWVEYARCEMQWLDRMEKKAANGAGRGGNGGDNNTKMKSNHDGDGDDNQLRLLDSDEEEEDDETGLPVPESKSAAAKIFDKEETQQLRHSPALDGAIPMAIFDISRKQPFYTAEVAETFFLMFSLFTNLPAHPKISQHVLDAMEAQFPGDPATCNCHIQQPIMGLPPNTAEFARRLGDALGRLGSHLETTTDRGRLEEKTVAWMNAYLGLHGLDEGIRGILEYTKGKLEARGA